MILCRESIKVAYIYLAVGTLVQFTFASSANIRNSVKRQNSICLNHTSGEFDRNPEDCRSFYLCLGNGQAIMAPCPPTMLFNPVSKLCDTADNVRCEIGTPSNTNSNSFGNAASTGIIGDNNNDIELLNASIYCASLPTEQSSIIFLASSSSCQQYFICYYGQAVLQECSANLHWNANIAKCDLPENADCTLSTGDPDVSVIGQVNSNGGNDPNGLALSGNELGEQTANGDLINCPIYGQHIFPHISRCDYFIYCVKGHAMLQQCPFYYHFDIVSKSCKLRRTAICVRDLNINFRKLEVNA